MKIKNNLIAIVSLLFISLTSVYAQDYSFKVLGSKGSNKLDGSPLRVGTRIKKAQIITVGTGAYLGLAHKNGKVMELKKAGVYKVAELEKKMSGGGSTLAGKYAQHILDELLSGVSGRFHQKVKTGAVDRTTFGHSKLQIMIPKKAEVINQKATIKWYLKTPIDGASGKITYHVKIKDAFDNFVLDEETTDTEVVLNLGEAKFKVSPLFLYTIKVVEFPNIISDEHGLHKMKKYEEQKVEDELASLNVDTSSALGNLILARFYEDKDLLAHAINAYEKAIKISSMKSYKHLYESFLERNYLTKESRATLED